jgi:PAS domain S-box-containing protein
METDVAETEHGNMFSGGSKRNTAYFKRLVIGVLCLNLLVLLLVAVLLFESRKTHTESALNSVTNLVKLLENEIVDTYEKVDLAIQSVTDEFEELGEANRSGINDWKRRLTHIRDSLPVLGGLRATNSTGDVIYGLSDKDSTNANLADRDYFKRLREESNAGLFISSPIQGRVTGQWVILLARRLNFKDGTFGGVVVASIPLDYFSGMFSSLKLYSKGSIGLRDSNLRLIVRYPSATTGDGAIGASKISDDFKKALKINPNVGSYNVSHTSIDRVSRLHHYRRNAVHGFYINVGFAHDDIYSAWHKLVWQSTGLVGLFMLGSLAFVWLMRKSMMQQHSITEQLVQSEYRYKDIVENQTDFVERFLPGGVITYVNNALARFAGVEAEALLGKSFYPFLHEEDRVETIRRIESINIQNRSFNIENRIVLPNGKVCWNRWTNTGIFDHSGLLVEYQSVGQDITERKQSEDALKESEERHRAILRTALDGFWLVDASTGKLIDINDAAASLLGYTSEELLTLGLKDIDVQWSPDEIDREIQKIKTVGKALFETRHRTKSEQIIDVEISVNYLPRSDQFFSFIRNITERKRAEEVRLSLEGQLHQAQKMESIGRLAGGVAHDFNNLLTVILGGAYLALMELEPGQLLHEYVTQIQNAANKSAELTQQLLAFARKQTIEPKVLDLNELVSGMIKMLQRLIGENTQLTWLPANNLWPVKADPSQIDQILANLCVNAKDSITDIGTITLQTGNSVVDEGYNVEHADVIPGEYVHISVCDSGCGMDKETMAHIFEPFFTTKGIGEGTGLGLATVYGAAKQNSGFVNVYSELGVGSTFTIYLPRYVGNTVQKSAKDQAQPAPRGLETILLVEDESSILNMTSRILTKLGYTVLASSNPGEAIRLANEHAGEIALLTTDVIMPEMNGKDLACNLMSKYPKLKCLFMSGYTADVISHHGVLDEGVYFIHKPFSLPDLAVKVRKVLDGK